MALLHRATLHPTKLELLAAWLPGRPWYQGQDISGIARVASYRFDDPTGAVGIETTLIQAGAGPLHQIPLTYRDAPLDEGDEWFVGTATHSVLGQRWVYDACGDPVYAEALANAIFAGTGQAAEFFEVDGQREHREPSMTVTSSAAAPASIPAVGALRRVTDDDPTSIVTDSVELTVVRRLGGGTELTGTELTGTGLTGTWSGQSTPVPLAYATLR